MERDYLLKPPPKKIGEYDHAACERAKLVLQQVADKHALTVEQLKVHTRIRRIAWPRQEYMYRAHVEQNVSLKTIARLVGLSDHTTVKHGISRHEQRLMKEVSVGAP